MKKASLPDQTRLAQVHLRTANLDRALAFYAGVLGLEPGRKEGPQVVLGAGKNPELLQLTEAPGAPSRPPRAAGLYHFALRFPSRGELARAYRRLRSHNYPLSGASDHAVSEALYLNDPEGNGIELYADRPRSEWHWQDGQVAMVTRPLELASLARLAAQPGEHASGLELGHIHLHVAELSAAERFYHEFLGLAVTQRSYPGALFFAAGGYHHHIAVNTWAGYTPPPANSVGLISYRLEVPCSEILYCLGHRAPLLGYQTRTGSDPGAHPLLQIRDPNGLWLDVQGAVVGDGQLLTRL
jgi:catechol 2,3-dioxygenase